MYLSIHPALRTVLKKLPKEPFVGCQYKTTLTDTANATLSTWNNVDIGVEHPNRVIIIVAFVGVNITATTIVHGVGLSQRARLAEGQITSHLVPTGKSVTITVSAVGSVRKAVSVYVAYPASISKDSVTVTAATTTNAVSGTLKSIKNGFLVYIGSQVATLGTFSTTWGGTDAVTEDVDAQLEAASSYTSGHINFAGASNDTFKLTLATSASGTKNLVVLTMGPPLGY